MWVPAVVHALPFLAPATSPPATAYAAIAYDTATSSAVLFGGENGNLKDLADTWTWG
jgi:hypothetical protein